MSSQRSQIIILIAVFLLFFSPVIVYRQTYSGGTPVSRVTGQSINFGISADYFHKNALERSDIQLLKYRTINLGIYSYMQIDLRYGKPAPGRENAYLSSYTFHTVGLGLMGSKKAAAENAILQEIARTKSKAQ